MPWAGILFLVGVSVYCLVRPDRFGMRVGLTYYPMPHSPLAKIVGWVGIAMAVALAVIVMRQAALNP